MSKQILHIEGVGEAQVIGRTETELILKVEGVKDCFYVKPITEYAKQLFDNFKQE